MILSKSRIFITALLCLQLAFAPTLAHSAGTTYRPADISAPILLDDIRRFESGEIKASVGAHLHRSEILGRALQAGQTAKLSDAILDPNLLVRQYLLLKDANGVEKKIYYSDMNSRVPLIQPSKLSFAIENGRFMAVASRGPEVLGRLVFEGIEAVSFAQNKDVVVVLDKSGRIYAFMRQSLIRERIAFQAPAPAMKVFSSGQHLGKVNENYRVAFITRGLSPEFTGLDQLKAQKDGVFPEGQKGELKLQAENVVVYEQHEGERRLKGIFAAPQIYNQIRVGTMQLAKMIFKMNLFGHIRSGNETFQRILQIDGLGSGESPLEEILRENEKLYASEELSKRLIRLEAKLQETVKGNPTVAAVFQKFSRDGLVDVISQLKKAGKLEGRDRDRFTIEQWLSSYEKIHEQGQRLLDFLDQELKKELSQEQRDRITQERQKIAEAMARGDLHDAQKKLTEQWIRGGQPKFDFGESQKAWYKKYLTRKNLTRVAIIGGSLAAAHYGLEFASDIVTRKYEVSQSVYLTVNWAYDMIPNILKDAGYRFILAASFITMLSLVPLNEILTASFAKPLRKIGEFLQKRGGKAKVLGDRLVESMATLEGMNVYQKMVTISARAFSYIIPYFEYISSLTGQSVIEAMRKGVNPFTKVKGDSEIGRRIGLKPGQVIRAGVNNPIRDPQLLNRWTFFFPYSVTNPFGDGELKQRQSDAIEELSKEKQRARVLAWTLATLTVSEKTAIDPATLAVIQSEKITIEQIAEIDKNSDTRKAWQQTARSLNAYLLHLVNQGKLDLSQLDPKEIQRFYKLAQETAEKIEERRKSRTGRLSNTLRDLVNRFRLISGPILTAVGSVGKSQSEFLRNVLTDSFVAKRVELGIKSDIPVSNTIAATIGKRADLSRPDYLFAQEGGFLFTNPQRWFEVVNNLYYAHLMSAASNKLLVFQSVKTETEKAYEPIESFQKASARPESLASSLLGWLQVFNFKKSNIGSYFTRTLQKRLSLAYVVIPMTILLRSAVGAQPLEMALPAALIFYFAASFSFGFPWTFLHRGSQLSSEKVAEARKKLESQIQRISGLLREGNRTALTGEYTKLIDLYRASDGVALKTLNDSLKGIESWMGLIRKNKLGGMSKAQESLFSRSMQRKMRSIFKHGEIEILLDGLAKLNEAKSQNDLERAKRIHGELAQLLKSKRSLPEFKELMGEIESRAKVLSAFAQIHPPVYTENHPKVEKTLTFWGGAVLSSVLFLSLSVLTFTPEALVWSNVGKWMAISVAFHTVIQAALGKSGFGWRLINPVVERAQRATQKVAKGIDQVRSRTRARRDIKIRMCVRALNNL